MGDITCLAARYIADNKPTQRHHLKRNKISMISRITLSRFCSTFFTTRPSQSVLWNWIRICMVPYKFRSARSQTRNSLTKWIPMYWSVSRRAKMTHKKVKKFQLFWSAGFSQLRAGDFSCILDVRHCNFWFLLVKYYNFWSSNPWIRIRNWVRIRIETNADPQYLHLTWIVAAI